MSDSVCPVCDDVVVPMDRDLRDRLGPIEAYATLDRLIEGVEANRLTHLRGDCELSETKDIVDAETKYTVVHFFRCGQCGDTLFFGICIRGWPIYKKVDPAAVDSWNFE